MTIEDAAEPKERKFWAVLLVLDAFFLVIFAGALGLKIYQYTGGISVPARTNVRSIPHVGPTTVLAVKATGSVPAQKTQKTAPIAAQATQTQQANPSKARAVLFQLSASRARSVRLVGAFLVKRGYKDMKKQSGGPWAVKLYLLPGNYRYYFLIDGRKALDPQAKTEKGLSVLDLQ